MENAMAVTVQTWLEKNIASGSTVKSEEIHLGAGISMEFAEFRSLLSEAIKNGQITGLSKAGRAGYRFGEKLDDAGQEKAILKDLPAIQAWLDKNLKDGEYLKGEEIYNGVLNLLSSDISSTSFRAALSAASCKGLLNIRGKRPVGYYRSDEAPVSKQSDILILDDEDEEVQGEVIIEIGESLRITNPDTRNWAVQKKSGSVWISFAYYHSIEDVFKYAPKMLLDRKLRDSKGVFKDAKALIDALNKCSEAIEDCFRAEYNKQRAA